MSLRTEFVAFASCPGVSVAEMCRRYQISRKTAYKWIARAQAGEPLTDRSRRPRVMPRQCPEAIEQAVLALRERQPTWGGRKIRGSLVRGGREAPAPSTITRILQRHGKLSTRSGSGSGPVRRFEHEHPNDLWQMDYKGHFAMERGGRCHALTVLDDHSRFSLAVRACTNEREATVRSELTTLFRTYGMPWRMLMDNGSPWGNSAEDRHTPLTVWLLTLGVGVTHGRPFHPQTQGKEERFHRTLKADVLSLHRMMDIADCQRRFDDFRHVYNHDRPHEALGMGVPAERYEPSPRSMPERIEPFEYGPDDSVRKVCSGGGFSFRGTRVRIPKAFKGEQVALRPTARDGIYSIRFRQHELGEVDLREPKPRLGARSSGRCAPSAASTQAREV